MAHERTTDNQNQGGVSPFSGEAASQMVDFAIGRLGCTQRQLARLLGVDETLVSHMKKGNRTLSFDNLIALARALDMSPTELFTQATGLSDEDTFADQAEGEDAGALLDSAYKAARFEANAEDRQAYRRDVHQLNSILAEVSFGRSPAASAIPILNWLHHALRPLGAEGAAIYWAPRPEDQAACLARLIAASDPADGEFGGFVEQVCTGHAGNPLRDAILLQRDHVVGMPRGGNVLPDANDPRNWCGEFGRYIPDQFEIIKHIPLKDTSLFLVISGRRGAAGVDWCAEDLVRRATSAIQWLWQARMDLLPPCPGELGIAPTAVPNRLDESCEAHISQFLMEVLEGDELVAGTAGQAAVVDFWPFDFVRQEFSPAAIHATAFSTSPSFKGLRDKYVAHADSLRPKSDGMSFWMMRNGRPWAVAMPHQKDEACIPFGSYAAIPLSYRGQAALSGVLFVRYCDTLNQFQEIADRAVEIVLGCTRKDPRMAMLAEPAAGQRVTTLIGLGSAG